ncbi:MAG: cation transporting ATPase C-terminal domain-containing protein, partial [Clostridia bacterium]|nr:cation transporting ATPase C-terminal domain-containing protein [Clostridia bacterium]
KRDNSIISKKMLIRILFNGVFVSGVLILQYLTNFLGANISEQNNLIFSLFVLFQLFNAFNSRELGSESIFKNIGKNKIMIATFLGVFVLHFIIVQYFSKIFGIQPMCLALWIKTILLSSSIVVVSELYKFVYRIIKNKTKSK